jgi:hypothetical protein
MPWTVITIIYSFVNDLPEGAETCGSSIIKITFMVTCAISWHKYCINKMYVRAYETHKLVISLFPTVKSVLDRWNTA